MSTANLPGAAGLTQALVPALSPAGRPGILSRIESWFRRTTVSRRATSRETRETFDTPADPDAKLARRSEAGAGGPRGRFPRPWADRRSAAENLNAGVRALAGLMAEVRDGLERQSARQEELLQSLAPLPEALRHLSESARLQGEATRESLTTVQGQIERQGAQQWQIADILERISRADAEQGRVLDALCRHESSFSENLARVDVNLSRVGEVIGTVRASSEAGARVLGQLCDGIQGRDAELGRALKGHNRRLTTLLCFAIGTSAVAVASVAGVAVAGFLLMHRMGLR